MAQVGEFYKNLETNESYKIYKITGEGKVVPSTDVVVWLKLVPTKSWLLGFKYPQQYISIPKTSLLDEFINVRPR